MMGLSRVREHIRGYLESVRSAHDEEGSSYNSISVFYHLAGLLLRFHWVVSLISGHGQPSAPPPRKFNPSSVEEVVTFRFREVEDEGVLVGELETFFDDIVARCSRGCVRILDLPVCHKDPRAPYLIAKIEISYNQLDAVISFFIEKESLYSYAVRIGEEGNIWFFVIDSPEIMDDECIPLGFLSNYQKLKGTVNTHGPGKILECVRQLRDALDKIISKSRDGLPFDTTPVQKPLKFMLHHLNEACRFKSVREDLISMFNSLDLTTTNEFTLAFQTLVQDWLKLSNAMLKLEQDTTEGKLKSESIWEGLMGEKFVRDTKIKTGEAAILVIAIVKKVLFL